MSNCIEIQNATVFFSSDEIDVEAFMKAVEEVKTLPRVDFEKHGSLKYTMWWYLSDNVWRTEDGGVAIAFGQGRSSHTWRDWRGTIRAVNTFMKTRKVVSMRFSDEFDGFATSSDNDVVFEPAK